MVGWAQHTTISALLDCNFKLRSGSSQAVTVSLHGISIVPWSNSVHGTCDLQTVIWCIKYLFAAEHHHSVKTRVCSAEACCSF